MKVLYIEGLANHIGPESCIGVRKGDGEALTGERTGWVFRQESMPHHELGYLEVPTLWNQAEGKTLGVAKARRFGTLRGKRPYACTDALCSGTGRSHRPLRSQDQQSVSGSRKTGADDERRWEVGSTRNVRRAARCSGGLKSL
jgi:hypothetical protein